jgi:rod shape determining protein RodA
MGITAGILLIAWLIQDLPRLHRVFGGSFSRIGVIAVGAGLPFLVAGAMGDTGSALVWVPVTVVALLIGGVAFRHILFMLLIGAGVLPIMYFVVLPSMDSGERAINRVDLWLKMQQGQEVDILDQGYSPHWATVAVGKSGWKGVGWNAPPEKNSVTARGKPSGTTNHNDYIFVVIAEELGFRGTLALLCAYAVLMVQCLLVAYYSRDVTGRLLAALVLTLIFAHVFESIGMCVLLLPVTGIPLPFISYSGTFVVICMFLMGLVQSVWIHRFDRPGRLAVSTG